MQRHLQTKHQIKREESPPIPYHPTTAPDGTTSSMLDIKPPPFLNYPYYAHPPWLGQVGQHDYHGYYQHQGRLTCSLHNFTKNEFQICVNFCNQIRNFDKTKYVDNLVKLVLKVEKSLKPITWPEQNQERIFIRLLKEMRTR